MSRTVIHLPWSKVIVGGVALALLAVLLALLGHGLRHHGTVSARHIPGTHTERARKVCNERVRAINWPVLAEQIDISGTDSGTDEGQAVRKAVAALFDGYEASQFDCCLAELGGAEWLAPFVPGFDSEGTSRLDVFEDGSVLVVEGTLFQRCPYDVDTRGPWAFRPLDGPRVTDGPPWVAEVERERVR